MRMNLLRVVLGSTCLLLVGTARLSAVEPVADFLHGLQDRGYGEMAVNYLETLKAANKLPPDIVETYDLELCNSLRLSVGEAFNQQEATDRAAKAQASLDKFLKEHPDHPQTADALISAGSISFDKAMYNMQLAKMTKEKDAKAKLLTEARDLLKASEPRFKQAVDRFAQQLELTKQAAVAGNAANPKIRRPQAGKEAEAISQAMALWYESRFKLGLVQYYIGMTYEDPKAKERKDALTAAVKVFDEIYQENRNENEVSRFLAGMYAHTWHGKTADEMGDLQTALDVYDEVQTTEPDTGNTAHGLEPLYARVEYFRLQLVKKKQGVPAFAAQAMDWLKSATPAKKTTEGYAGIALEVAKAGIEQASKETGPKKDAFLKEAEALLTVAGKIPGEFLSEVLHVQKSMRKGTNAEINPTDFAQAIALGTDSFNDGDFATALTMFQKAIEFDTKKKEKVRGPVDDALAKIDVCKYQIAIANYQKGDMDAVVKAAGEMATTAKDSPMAPPITALAISARLTQYATAADAAAKETALQNLIKIAGYAITTYPDKPEADDARIALAQANLVQGKVEEALKGFEEVNPRSVRYPNALYEAGRAHWRLYSIEKKKPEAERVEASLTLHRQKAEEQLKESYNRQQEAYKKNPDKEGPPEVLLSTQLILAEVYVETNQGKEAVELVAPLIDDIKNAKPETIDTNVQRTFIAALRAYKLVGDLAKMNEVATLLTELGPDSPDINNILTAFVLRTFVDELKLAQAAEIQAEGPLNKEQAKMKVDAVKEVIGGLLDKLQTREQNPPPSLIFIADVASEIGKTEVSRELYVKVEAQGSQPNSGVTPQALTRVRAQLVGLLRQEAKFAEAAQQADKLIETNPKALEPRMEKGRILQEWSKTEPSKFQDAVSHWTGLRTMMQPMKKKPPQYYEVVMNTAACLLEAAKTEKDPAKAEQSRGQAEQLLNATMFLSPALDGPDTVARFQEMLLQMHPDKSEKREKYKAKFKAEAAAKAAATAAAGPAPAAAPPKRTGPVVTGAN